MAATNEQVQQWSDQRTRVRCEAIRALLLSLEDDNASIGEVYDNLTGSPDWTDNRSDGPPSLLGPNDLLAINALSVALVEILRGTSADDAARIAAVNAAAAQLPIVYKACVRPAIEP